MSSANDLRTGPSSVSSGGRLLGSRQGSVSLLHSTSRLPCSSPFSHALPGRGISGCISQTTSRAQEEAKGPRNSPRGLPQMQGAAPMCPDLILPGPQSFPSVSSENREGSGPGGGPASLRKLTRTGARVKRQVPQARPLHLSSSNSHPLTVEGAGLRGHVRVGTAPQGCPETSEP